MAGGVSHREFISPEGLRMDGRRANEVRRIKCKLGAFSGVDGSALYEQGNTRVSVSVYGPREVKLRHEALHDRAVIHCEFSMAPFSTSERKRYSKQDRRFTEMALLLRQTFESVVMTHLFPRSQISIFVQVLQSDGGVQCAAINAATLALINAGIPMRGFLSACTSSLLDGTPVLDVNYVETSTSGVPEVSVAAISSPSTMSSSSASDSEEPILSDDTIVLLQLDSKLPLEHLQAVLSLALRGCREVYRELKQHVADYSRSLS